MSCLPSGRRFANPAVAFLQRGAGESILLLHGSAASSVMWRPLMEILEPLYQVIAPDLIGYGNSPAWTGTGYTVEEEARAIQPLLPCCGGPFHLVGYSYGGLAALALALANPLPVRTLTLIEPVFFSALRSMNRADAYARFAEEAARFQDTLNDGYPATAINRFINFWCGEGTWERHSASTRMAMLTAVQKVALDWQAAFAFDPGRERLQILSGRAAIFGGDQSPKPMQQLIAAVHRLMPGSTHATVRGAGHLLPLTHRAEVAKLLLEHLHIKSERRAH